MSKSKTKVSNEVIESFLQGSNPEKYIVAIESNYNEPKVTLVINDPEKGKYLYDDIFKPFLWFKEDVTSIIYGGKRLKIMEACKEYGIKITKLITSNEEGYTPDRMENGYKYMATCKHSYNNLLKFFKDGGVDVFSDKRINPNDDKSPMYRSLFVMFSPTEQYLIQSGKRLFNGMDDYDDVHRFQFDLETEGLFASKNAIFQIGVRDNKGLEGVLETIGDTSIDKRNSERENIEKFFKIIDAVQPDIITGYNSENFDWPFLFERAERLSIPITELAITLNRLSKIKRKDASLKLGGETEQYKQTHMFGYNIMDISHAVRRAMAINSEIKSWGLKYITQYSEIAKPNRVYVPGDKINTTWADKKNQYAFNNTDGDWYIITDKKQLKDGYKIVKGDYIVQRYLCDDLWETEQIDNIFNQASFLIAKMLPTTFMRSSTMGTAGQWKLIMAAWSYERGLAIPAGLPKRDFTGGLSRLLEVGYARGVVKLDFAALYPKIQLTHLIFPDLDISGVMEGMLTYVVDTRDKFKFLTGTEKKKAKKLEAKLKDGEDLTTEDIDSTKKEIIEHKALANLYDKKQLPLKILANSWFGSYGAPYIFNWGDTDSAEETTCRGRQYLRLMVRHFTEKHGFRALVGDSVTYDTPVYVRYSDGTLDVKPICDLFNEDSEYIDLDGLRDYEAKPFEVLTVNGWKNINYVYRHGTDKQIHRVTTKDRLVNVTEDHSLFQDGIQIKPSTLKRGDSIDVYNQLDKFDSLSDLSEDQAWLYGFFLGDGSANCSDRTRKYISRKTGKIHLNKSKRSDWKISNSRLDFLEKLRIILEKEFGVIGLVKDHMKSSGVYNLVAHKSEFSNKFCNDFYTSYREKKVPNFILNSNEKIKRAFLNGVCASDGYGDDLDTCSSIGMKSQVAMAGLSILFNELNIEYNIVTRNDKQNFISFILKNHNRNNSSFTNKTLKKTNEVWKNEVIINNDKNKFVYDISTEDGTFIGGIGLINLKNTDGFNFAFPDNIDEIKYVANGSHWKTTDDGGKELTGLDAVLAEFNENYMEGRMGLDIDDICNSTINFARKNYANDIGGKIKLVGNSVKSKKMSVYIEEFLGKGIRMLLDGDGYSFINHYYEYVDKIYNYQIPLVKMASKAKIKTTITEYKKKSLMKNKAGNPMPKQAHMELAMREGLDVTLGDTLFYINTGTSKSHGDLKTIYHNKMTNKQLEKWYINNGLDKIPPNVTREVQLNCKLINPETIEKDFENIKELEVLKKALIVMEENGEKDTEGYISINERIVDVNNSLYTDEYNVARYLEAFNKKVRPLLVCFNEDVRSKVVLDIIKVKDKITKKTTEKLKERTIFTKSECELISGIPFKDTDQDSYEDLMKMEDKEIKFWDKVNKVPNNMEVVEWEQIRADYHERMRIARLDGIQYEKDTLDDIFKHLEIKDLNLIKTTGDLQKDIFIICDVNENGDGTLISRKWGEPLCHILDIFKYEKNAIERDKYYQMIGNNNSDDRYEQWLDYVVECNIMTGQTYDMFVSVDKGELSEYETEVVSQPIDGIIEKVVKKAEKIVIEGKVVVKKKRIYSEGEEDDDEIEEDENGNLIRNDEELQLDDEYDDTFGEIPDDYVRESELKEEVRCYSKKEQILIDNGFIEYNGVGCWVRKNWLEKQSFIDEMIVNEKRAYDMIKRGYGFNSWLETEPEDEWGF
jgi:DNA polymerase elongation subunit (family B)